MPTGNLAPTSFQLGEDLYEQVITITGAPLAAGLTFSYLDRRAAGSASESTSAIDLQTILRTLPECESITVSGPTGGPWRVAGGPDASLIEPIRVHSVFIGGTNPGITVAVTARRELLHALVIAGGIAEVSVPPTVAKSTTPSENTERADQTKASEWITLRNLSGGFGRFHYDEGQSVNRFWDSECWTHVKDQITLPAAVESYAIHSDLGAPAALVASEIGVTAHGARIIQTVDPTGAGSVGYPCWLDVETNELKPLPYATLLTADTPRADVIFFYGYAYIGFEKASDHGYLAWDGDSSTNAVLVETTQASPVVAFCEFDSKLFRLLKNGDLQFTSVPTGVTDWYAAEADWSTVIATYRGLGYAYMMKVFRNSQGADTIFIIATDGLYSFDFDTYILTRIQEINGSIVPAGGYYPQPNGVQIHNGNLHWVHADRSILRFDGSSIVNLGPNIEDGLPERSIAIDRDIRVRSILSLNNYLLAFCSASTLTGSAGVISSPTTISNPTYYINTLTVSGELTVSSELTITSANDTAGVVLLYNGEGWHTLVPLNQPNYAGITGSRGGIYHELGVTPRLEFAPGKFIRFRDKPNRPQDWADQVWDTSTPRSIVTGYFDSKAPDIDKTALFTRFGYHNAGNGCTLTPYFEIDDCPDTPEGATSTDPSAGWAAYVDETNTVLVIGSGSARENGEVRGFFERDMVTGGIRGLVFRQLRKRIDLASSDNARTPILHFASTPYTARYDTLFQWPSIHVNLSKQEDGRSVERQITDLRQLARSKRLHVFRYDSDNRFVYLDAVNQSPLSPGPVQDAATPPVAIILISEWTRV